MIVPQFINVQALTQEIEEQCEQLERIGVIEESDSPWNSPLVPIRKSD